MPSCASSAPLDTMSRSTSGCYASFGLASDSALRQAFRPIHPAGAQLAFSGMTPRLTYVDVVL